MRMPGTVCTMAEEYDQRVGTVFVTARAHVGGNWVLPPTTPASIEVTGEDLTSDIRGISADRISLVECNGECGVSDVSPHSASPKPTLAAWAALAPVASESPPQQLTVNYTSYVVSDGEYCLGSNIDPEQVDILRDHKCYTKCVLRGPCVGDDCHCSGETGGLYVGFDGPSSDALCLTEEQCRLRCSALSDCVSIDMDKTKNRCFLNSGPLCATSAHEDLVGRDTKYKHIIKQIDGIDQGEVNFGRGPVYAADGGRRLANVLTDLGYSFDNVLRFSPIMMASGGRWKVCFCDSTLIGEPCSREEHFPLEVGYVHVSGVECLLQDSSFQRGFCRNQFHGGLRCYDTVADEPELVLPGPQGEPLAPFPSTAEGLAMGDVDSEFASLELHCVAGSEETARSDPRCREVLAGSLQAGVMTRAAANAGGAVV